MFKSRWLNLGLMAVVAMVMALGYGGLCGGSSGSSGGTPTPQPAQTAPDQVTTPAPANNASGVITTTQLSWAAATGAASYDVYFGLTYTGWSAVTNTITTGYNPGALTYSTAYYWRIDSINSVGATTGTVWAFTTPAPVEPETSAEFKLMGLVNNGYQDDNLWLGKYAAGTLSTESLTAKDFFTTPGDIPYEFVKDATGVYVIGSSGFAHGYFAKYNASTGALIWKRLMAAAPIKIKLAGGSIYLGGTVCTEADDNDIWIAKYDPDGVLAWELTRPNNQDRSSGHFDWLKDLAVDGSGNVTALGALRRKTANELYTFYDIWLAKTSTGGSWDWELTKNGTADMDDLPTALVLDTDGTAFVLGQVNNGTNGYWDLDIWLGKTYFNGTATVWGCNLNKSGAYASGNTKSNDTPTALKLDGFSRACVLGQTQDGASTFNTWLGKAVNGLWDCAVSYPATPRGLAVAGNRVYVLGQTTDVWLGMTTDIANWTWSLTRTGEAGFGYATDLAVRTQGITDTIYVMGNLSTVTTSSSSDLWLGATDNSGLGWLGEWRKSGSNNSAGGQALKLDSAGAPYLLGTLSNITTVGDIWLGKPNLSVNNSWDWQLARNGDIQYSTDCANTDGLIVDSTGIYALGLLYNEGFLEDQWLAKTTTGAAWDWQSVRKTVGINNVVKKTDASGNIYVATTIQQFTPITKQAVWVAKFNSDTTLAWQSAGNSIYSDHVKDINVDGAGNVYVLGTNTNVWLDKINSAGAWQWHLTKAGSNTFYGGTDKANSILIDANDDVYVTGLLNNGTTQYDANYDIWLGKPNTNGTAWEWDLAKDTTGYQDEIKDFKLGPNGSVYVLGQTDIAVYPSYAYAIWLGKAITSSGTAQWSWDLTKTGTSSVWNNFTQSMVVTGTDVYVLGRVEVSGIYNIWVGKASSGAWANELTDNPTWHSYPKEMALDGAGNVYVLGESYSTPCTNIWLGKADAALSAWSWALTKTGIVDNLNLSRSSYPYGLWVDSTGAYVLGQIQNHALTLDNYDIWLGKACANGTAWEWDYTKSGTAGVDDSALSWLVSNGTAYVMGRLQQSGTWLIQNIGSGYQWICLTDSNTWLLKYDGTVQYEALKANTAKLDDAPKSISLDANGNAFIYGDSPSREQAHDIRLAKYGPLGTLGYEITKAGTEDDVFLYFFPVGAGWTDGQKVSR
ncbi:MAG: hypothetical protein V1701_10285 [Planctomycetota bacterium]